MFIRIIAYLALAFSVLYFPWWVSALLLAAAALYLPWFLEGIVFAILADALYGIPAANLYGVAIVYTLGAVCIVFAAQLVRRRLRFLE